jgi:GNAT superfamily N-acetyltransferase
VAETGTIHIQRLGPHDAELARTTFAVIAEVFGETHAPLSDAYVAALLARPDFWGFAATHAGQVVGGLTAHALMMTAYEGSEVVLYDIAVAPDQQRRGIGRQRWMPCSARRAVRESPRRSCRPTTMIRTRCGSTSRSAGGRAR